MWFVGNRIKGDPGKFMAACYILTAYFLLFLTRLNHPAHNPCEGVWRKNK